MKRNLPILLIICLLCALTASCSEPGPEYRTDVDAGPVKVLIDLKFANSSSGTVQSKMKHFSKNIKSNGGPSKIEIEYPPASGEEREAFLTRMRTELMAGKGPDVYICASGYGYHYTNINGVYEGSPEYALFKFPTQAMDNRFFLPLDKYIENAKLMEWDKLTPAIMDAGKNQKGQQVILPLSYTMPVTYFKKDYYQHEHSSTMTFEEAMAMDEQMQAATYCGLVFGVNEFRDLVDYRKDCLAITEEEYLEFIKRDLERMQAGVGDGDEAGTYLHTFLRVSGITPDDFKLNSDKYDITMVPLYCHEGGYGATIETFGAVNANTENPAGAFFILDYMLSKEGQRSDLTGYFLNSNSIPIYEGLMQRGQDNSARTDGFMADYFAMSPANYEEFCSLRENMTWARFRTVMEKEFFNPSVTYFYDQDNKKSLEELVHDNYVLMNMMLGES